MHIIVGTETTSRLVVAVGGGVRATMPATIFPRRPDTAGDRRTVKPEHQPGPEREQVRRRAAGGDVRLDAVAVA